MAMTVDFLLRAHRDKAFRYPNGVARAAAAQFYSPMAHGILTMSEPFRLVSLIATQPF